jgi:hypothetical protein
MFHYGNPKNLGVPRTADDAIGLFSLFVAGTAPGEADQWLNMNTNDGILRVLLADHTYQTLNNVQARLAEFVQRRSKWDPAYKKVEVVYLGGITGLYAAANDVLYELDFVNITFVLAVVFLFCAVVYRSLVGRCCSWFRVSQQTSPRSSTCVWRISVSPSIPFRLFRWVSGWASTMASTRYRASATSARRAGAWRMPS